MHRHVITDALRGFLMLWEYNDGADAASHAASPWLIEGVPDYVYLPTLFRYLRKICVISSASSDSLLPAVSPKVRCLQDLGLVLVIFLDTN